MSVTLVPGPPIPTPCGTINTKVPLIGLPPIPSISDLLLLLAIPPIPEIPLPDCGPLKHLGADGQPPPAEPASDTKPKCLPTLTLTVTAPALPKVPGLPSIDPSLLLPDLNLPCE